MAKKVIELGRGDDQHLPKPAADRGRQGTALGVPPPAASVVPRGDPYALQPSPAVMPAVTAATCPKCGLELPADAKFCGVCGGEVARAAVVAMAPAAGSPAPVIALSVTLSAPPAPVSSPAPTVAPAPSSATSAAAQPSGAITQKLPAAKSGKGRRTLMGELEALKLIQAMEDRAELTNLGRAVLIALGVGFIVFVIGFIVWAVLDGRSRRHSVLPVSNAPVNITVPFPDAGPVD